jgi:transglutaminase-like putative cysteine protease
MRLQVTHVTHYDYAPCVETAQHMAYLQPLESTCQRLLSHTLQIFPTPAQTRPSVDVFGNTRCFFSLQTPHSTLEVQACSVLETSAQARPESQIAWEKTRELFRYRSGQPYEDASEFVFASPHVVRHADFVAYARPSFAPGLSLLDAATDLMQRIHADFRYVSHSTQVDTPALEALAQRRGVCQDFAHIMLACLRAMGLAARYVSGYMLTHAAPGTVKLKGGDASHAWVSVYFADLPAGSRWCDFDPTNNRCGWQSPGEDYVTLAIGRDFSDVSPLRGVIHGGAHSTLSVGVTVESIAMDAPYSQAMGQRQTQTQTQSQSQSQSQS